MYYYPQISERPRDFLLYGWGGACDFSANGKRAILYKVEGGLVVGGRFISCNPAKPRPLIYRGLYSNMGDIVGQA